MSQCKYSLFLPVFLRKTKNKSGVISVQIIDKSSGKYRMIKTIGSSSDPNVVNDLVSKAKQWIKAEQRSLEFTFDDNANQISDFLNSIKQINVVGTDLLLGKIYDEIGFNQIEGSLFKLLVLARITFPVSNLKTVDYLAKYHLIDLNVQNVYRYLDKLYADQKELIQQISYDHTLKVLNGVINVVFYDVTTLYFQIDDEDEIRKRGFSKEGKHQNPQIALGLLVSTGGYPLAFEIFEGNKFEGHTMLPVLDSLKKNTA